MESLNWDKSGNKAEKEGWGQIVESVYTKLKEVSLFLVGTGVPLKDLNRGRNVCCPDEDYFN